MMKKNIPMFLAGLFCGAALFGGSVAYAAGILATPTTDLDQRITLNGQEIALNGYVINGNNYFQLADLGSKLGFSVGWDKDTRTVVITTNAHEQTGDHSNNDESTDPYHAAAETGSKYLPKVGDQILCDDGTVYCIQNVDRYYAASTAPGKLPALPAEVWGGSSLPQAGMLKPAARRITNAGDELFVRNLYETRRMQYTLYMAAQRTGSAKINIHLGIPATYEPMTQVFWPWNEMELTKQISSSPRGTYYVEAWDCYLNGVFQHTRYYLTIQ